MLCNARQQMLNENAVGIRPKLDGRRFQRRARAEDGFFWIEVVADITRHSADVVDDDEPSGFAAFADGRSAVRRVGKECVSTCSSRWGPYHLKRKECAADRSSIKKELPRTQQQR